MPYKLIIQIPCFNEEATLPETLATLPRELDGVDAIEWLIVDDGSLDRTVEVAREGGVDHIVSLPRNRGLAAAFSAGLSASLELGADIIVNTDADNQYVADDIPKLIEPILTGRAEIVVGARSIEDIEHFSGIKKRLHRFGSWVVRFVSGTNVEDAPSGFRAMDRRAAKQLKVFSRFSYTLETIIQAGFKDIEVISVPVRTNPETRPSRLMRSMRQYVFRSMGTIVRIFLVYRPFRFFVWPGVISFGLGFLVGFRFLIDYLITGGAGHVQSLIFATILIVIGAGLVCVGILADLISVNRRLMEDVDLRLQKVDERLAKLNRFAEGAGPGIRDKQKAGKDA